jgi:hypothetical protein
MKTKHIFGSSVFLTVFLALCCAGVTLLLCGCPSPSSDPDPIIDPDPAPSEDGKTYVIFSNSTEYRVNVYIASPPTEDSVPFAEVQAGSTAEQWEIAPSQTDVGDPFYFEYIVPLSDTIQLPYYHQENVKIRKILKEQKNTITVDDLHFISTDSVFLVIQNKASDPIWLARGGSPQYPVGFEHEDATRNIEAGETAVYRFTSLMDLNNLSIRHNTATKPLPQYTCEANQIYLIRYEQNTPALFQVQSFDPAMADKIWSITTGSATGQHLVMGLLAPRLNPADGYLALGRITYSPDTVLDDNVQSKGYFAAISQEGNIITEKFVTLKDNPMKVNFRRFIEYPDEFVFYGQVYYDDSWGKPFVWSTDKTGTRTNYYNADFTDDIDPDTENMYSGRMAKKNDNVYAAGGSIWNSDREMYSSFITEVTKTDFDTVSQELLWRSTEDADMCDLIYDQNTNRYIVAAFDWDSSWEEVDKSYLYIINADTGEEMVKQEFDGRYIINAFAAYGGSYYATGAYVNAGYMQGFLRKINPSTGAFEWSAPVFFDYNGTADTAIHFLTIDGSKLVLGGWADIYDDDEDTGTLPYLLAFDVNARTTLWEQVYKDIWQSQVYSVNPNGIGSYIVEFYSDETYMSRLVSTGLMGELNTNRKSPIPNNPSLTVITPSQVAPRIRINPLEDAEVDVTEVEIEKGESRNITVTGTYSAYEWYLDGVKQVGTGSSYSIATGSMAPGVHTLTVVVTDSAGGKRSASCRITVTN